MNKLNTHLLVLICALCMYATATAQTNSQKSKISALYTDLSKADSPNDSIKVYYDILDLSPRKDYKPLARQIWGVAARAKRPDVQLEICRQLTAAVKKDSVYAVLEDAVSRLPESDEQRETLLFIRMKRVSYKSRYTPEEERQKEITKIITAYDKKREPDKYDKLLTLFTLVEYLRNDVPGDLLQKYIDDLFAFGTSSDFSLYAIPNIIYAETANSYTMAQDYAKALEADRKLLEVIAGLEKKYAGMGRKYRNYDISRYVSYRRMLQNFEALQPGEAEQLYGKIKTLAVTNSDVKEDLEQNPTAKAFYSMAVGDYASAIPLLNSLSESSNEVARKRRFLELLVKASEQVGDDKTRMKALELYNGILEEYSRLKAAERYRELQVKYDIKSLQERNKSLELESVNEKIGTGRKIMVFVTAAFIILLIAFIITLFYWVRFRRNSYNLGYVVNRLSHERDRMRHSVLYDHDKYASADDHENTQVSFEEWCRQRRFLFSKDINVSTSMMQCIINDLILIAFLGKKNRMAHISSISVDEMMRTAVTRAYEAGGVHCKISADYPEDDFSINSDIECLTYIISRILNGMASHNIKGGVIKLESRLTEDNRIQFIFTAPSDFTLHEDTDAYKPIITAAGMAEGSASGIFIDRTIALLLASDIKSDLNYKEGTRFIFTTPANLK